MSAFAEPLAQARATVREAVEKAARYDEWLGYPTTVARARQYRAALDLIEQRVKEMLADPVSWREQTFRLRMEAAEQRAADMEEALWQASLDLRDIADSSPNWMVPNAVADHSRECVRLAREAHERAENAALSAREEAQP